MKSSADDSSEESKSLLCHSEYDAGKDGFMFESAQCLNYIVVTVALAVMLALLMLVVNAFDDNAIPIIYIFVVLWFGHLVILGIDIYAVRLIFSSIDFTKGKRHANLQHLHQANERRIPLIQFVGFHLLWILGLSFVLVLFEIIMYLQYVGIAKPYSVFVLAYFILTICLATSLICRWVLMQAQ